MALAAQGEKVKTKPLRFELDRRLENLKKQLTMISTAN